MSESQTERHFPTLAARYREVVADDAAAAEVASEIARRASEADMTMLAVVWGLTATTHRQLAEEDERAPED